MLGLGRSGAVLTQLAALVGGFSAVALPIYFLADLGSWSPSFTGRPTDFALLVGFFFLPSLPEELLWRWLLIPPSAFGSTRRAALAIGLSSAVFTAAHPLAAAFFVPHAWSLFTHPAFLLIVFLLGVTCGTAYVASKSVWPPVVIHWLTVLAWKFLFGGPFVLLGR